ncbi:MAG: hypothetical protein HY296_06210 [Thaumarchaeota archaeon]|nr:hypothetical protein [Nitrososphaerota archaeon]
MTLQNKILYGIIALLVAVTVVVSSVAGFYFYQYNQAESANQAYVRQLRQLNVHYSSALFIDYGNGTKIWYNNTKIEPGWNLYVLTQIITNGHMNATYYPQYGSHFVTAIYNIANTRNEYWLLWTYNSTSSWRMAQVGPDQLQIYNGSVYAWSFCGSNCPPP